MLLKIYGERNSGTRYLEKLLTLNFPFFTILSSVQKGCKIRFWKHGLPTTAIYKEFPKEKIIHIFIVRKVAPWITSMYQKPWHLIPPSQFDDILHKKVKINETDRLFQMDGNFINFEDKDKTMMEIRYFKLKNYLHFFHKDEGDALMVDLDILKNNHEFVMGKISQLTGTKPMFHYKNVFYHSHTTEWREDKKHVLTKKEEEKIKQLCDNELESLIFNCLWVKKNHQLTSYELLSS